MLQEPILLLWFVAWGGLSKGRAWGIRDEYQPCYSELVCHLSSQRELNNMHQQDISLRTFPEVSKSSNQGTNLSLGSEIESRTDFLATMHKFYKGLILSYFDFIFFFLFTSWGPCLQDNFSCYLSVFTYIVYFYTV